MLTNQPTSPSRTCLFDTPLQEKQKYLAQTAQVLEICSRINSLQGHRDIKSTCWAISFPCSWTSNPRVTPPWLFGKHGETTGGSYRVKPWEAMHHWAAPTDTWSIIHLGPNLLRPGHGSSKAMDEHQVHQILQPGHPTSFPRSSNQPLAVHSSCKVNTKDCRVLPGSRCSGLALRGSAWSKVTMVTMLVGPR